MQVVQNTEQFIKGMKMDKWTAGLLTGAACVVGAVVVLVNKINNHRGTMEKIERARNRREESLQRAEQAVLRYKQSHPMTDSAFIMDLSLSELTKQLKEDSLSPEDVLYSYMEKTLAVNKKLNCCTEILLESFDQLKAVGSNKEGILYGVPVSIKENVAFKKHDCSCGVVINLDQPVEKDSVLVEVLKKQGAIPFVKTNLPQGLISYDCSNPIYGQTVNPHNPQKTSGGSSGGEGALIGGGGSLLGIGSDLGGSIRIPASFCGICGFKPTAGRLSLQGLRPIYRGQKAVSSSPGPMAKDVDSLVLCMQALLCDHMFSLDPTVPPLPFNNEMILSFIYPGSQMRHMSLLKCFNPKVQKYLKDMKTWMTSKFLPLNSVSLRNLGVTFDQDVPFDAHIKQNIYRSSKPLRIGYLEDDGYSQPSPSMVRCIREVKALLEQAGHTLVPYQPLKMDHIVPELMWKSLFSDGASTLLQKLKGGPVDPCLKAQVFTYSLPKWLKKLLSFLLKPVSPRVSANISALCGVRSVPDLWKQHAAVEDYIHETIAQWRSCNIDVLLCPMIGPAYNFLYCGRVSTVLSYTMLYNILTFPAGVVPVSTVTAEDEEKLKHYKGYYQDKWDKLFKKAVTGGEGLPVGVQCVALPWQDELCLRFMKEVEQLVKQSKK